VISAAPPANPATQKASVGRKPTLALSPLPYIPFLCRYDYGGAHRGSCMAARSLSQPPSDPSLNFTRAPRRPGA
jgi:hypothetical protein